MGRVEDYLKSHIIQVIILVALFFRLLVYWLIPVDWNSDSYHHWLISYLTLHIGLREGRLWDLLGCDYYWGMIPHLVQAGLLWVFRSSSIEYIRLFNVLVGSLNAVLVFLVAQRYYGWENAVWSGVCFAVFPVSLVFDSIGMQDTLALMFVLGSLYFMRTRFFWGGLLLGLACHTRVEYTLVSLLVLGGFVLRERLFTDSQPYLLGWFVGWGVPSVHIWVQTGNPVYPLYWSLYSVFGGYTSKFRGLPFVDVFFGWLGSRVGVWGGSLFGWLIIGCGLAGLLLIPWMAYRRWFRYEPLLYWVSCLMVMAPLFLPYFGGERRYLLMMIRFLVPIVALGLPVLFHFVRRFQFGWCLLVGTLGIFFLGSVFVVPLYGGLQGTVVDEFGVADRVAGVYVGGVVVCDLPSTVYRLVDVYGVEPDCLLSNLYGPHYYGVDDPLEYLRWLKDEDVSVWCYFGDRGDPVWSAVEGYSGVFLVVWGEPRAGVYIVDQVVIDDVL
ncbi:MAG: glycosyltransferase family 39 protein [Candidatus Bathyarchaeota archaeon]|nr:glycosyltransferase family 39 protein [Candidatus Bathyarchaeota archaeon]